MVRLTRSALALAMVAALAGLSACEQKPAGGEVTATATRDDAANPDAKPGLAISDGKMVLPAVKGNPAAAYFTLSNGGERAATLAGAFIEGSARAEMHETKGGQMSPMANLELAPGAQAVFEPGGKHVMAFDLADTLAAGGTAEMTLTFADGDKLSAPLAIEAPGGGGAHSGH